MQKTMIGNLIGIKQPVLDHGHVTLIDFMGSDAAVLQAARISTGAKASKSPEEDRGLLRYMMRARHTSPFEMCEIKLHVKLPIFVARQWIRHRTANVNEMSARYTELPEEFYIPAIEQVQAQSTDNRQGRAGKINDATAQNFIDYMEDECRNTFSSYRIDIEDGISRELARIPLPLSTYTEWFWKIDLHNLLHFLKLRTDAHAQWEIRQYADVIAKLVKLWVPITYEAFEDYVVNARTFSAEEMKLLRAFLYGCQDSFENWVEANKQGLSAREQREFINTLFPEN